MVLAFGQLAPAADVPARRNFDVPANDALVSLKQFAEQCGQEIIYPDTVKGTPTKAVHGSFTSREALDVMLAGTGLVATQAKSGALAVNPVPDPNVSRAAPSVTRSDRPAAKNNKASDSNDDTVALTPFEVRASSGGYGALDSNSITGFRADLAKLPVTADIYTESFMQDIAATSVEEMIVQYGGAGMQTSDAGGNGAFNNSPGDRNSSTAIVLRGHKISVHRDGFQAAITSTKGLLGGTDNFSTERGELIHGANSLLYGDSGGGGVLNIVSKQARFDVNPFGGVSYMVDRYGAYRAVADFGMGYDKVAVRLAMMDGASNYRRDNLGGPTNGKYLQLAFKLPFRSVLRVWSQIINAAAVNSVNANAVPNFLPPGDPRGKLALRYLVATGQADDIHIIPNLNLNNVDSFRGSWQSDHIQDNYTGASLETSLTPWLSSQLAVAFDENSSWQPSGGGQPFPAGGATGTGNTSANPFPFAAVPINTPGDSTSHDRRTNFRATLLADNQFFGGRVRSQTIVGAELGRQDTHGEVFVYALTDASGNVIVDPTKLASDRGMTLLTGPLWFSIGTGLNPNPVLYGNDLGKPINFPLRTQRVTVPDPVTGAPLNYVRVQRRIRDNSQITPTNPQGTVGNNGNLTKQYVESHSYYVSNLSQWFGGRIETLTGLRYGDISQGNVGATGAWTALQHAGFTYVAGVSYEVRPWLHVFADIASSGNPQLNTQDPYGVPNLSSEGGAPIPDIGVKFSAFDGRIIGEVTWVPQNTLRHDAVGIDGDYLTAINPQGVNNSNGFTGRYSTTGLAPNSQINVDRTTTAIEANLEFKVKKNWRASLHFNATDGSYLNTVSYNQVYNDQFYANATGTVTYADGTPVQVNPTKVGVVASGGVPLTIAMMNTSSNIYYANPNVDSGHISSNNLLTILRVVDPVHGAIATGATGLPLSAIQYNFTDPNGHHGVISPVVKGDKTNGYYRYTLSFVNKYDFDRGWLKGFGLGGTVNAGYQFRSHYYPIANPASPTNFTTTTRAMYLRPTVATFGLIASYEHKLFSRYRFKTQLNIQNMFNHYQILLPPSTALTPPFNNVVFTTEPRRWVWTNSISF
jgi:hypothetical protein